jgi:tRNA U55 pseudouridine synthase TruB
VTTSELSAVLLLLFSQKNFLVVRDDYLATLRGIEGFIDQQPSAVNGWPIYRYAHEGRTLSVCVAMVHLS